MAFRLSPAETLRLRHLVRRAVRLRHVAQLKTQPTVLYTIQADGRLLEVGLPHVPSQLVGLVGLLSGLIQRYS